MERLTEINPAYDKRSDEPEKNYGIHGVDLRFVLKGELGAVQFVIYTNWHNENVQEEFLAKRDFSNYGQRRFLPMPADVGFHSPKPMDYQDESDTSRDECPYLDGKPCYYDGSGLHADKVYWIMVNEGGEAMWDYLEEFYKDVFGELK